MTHHHLTALLDGIRLLGPRLADHARGAEVAATFARSTDAVSVTVSGDASLGAVLTCCDRVEAEVAQAPALDRSVQYLSAVEGPLRPEPDLAELGRLLVLQPGPCQVRVRVRPCSRQPDWSCSEELARIEARLRGMESRSDRQVETRLPEDLLSLRARRDALMDQVALEAALARGALELQVAVHGDAGRDLLHCVGRTLLGARGFAWSEEPGWTAVPRSVAGDVLSVDRQPLPGLPLASGRRRALIAPPCEGAVLGDAHTRRGPRPVGLGPQDLARHLYVTGKTGVGKSTLLKTLVVDVARRGEALALIDPHGDLADEVCRELADLGDRLVVLDPRTVRCPGLDPLHHDGTPAGQERAIEQLTAVLWKLFPPEYMGASFDRHSRALLLPLVNAGEPLESVLAMDCNEEFRQRMLDRLSPSRPLHREVLSFWKTEYAGWTSSDRAEMRNFTVSKYETLLRSPALRRACGKTRAQLDLEACAAQGKVVVARLPQGELGPVTAWFMGMLLMSRVQDAVFAQARKARRDRAPFTVVIDEFQNFVGGGGFGYTRSERTLGPLLSEGRKFGLRLVLANQYMAQLDDATQAAILGNVGSLVGFRCGGPDAQVLSDELGVPPQELVDLPLFQAVARLLQDGRRTAPFSLRTRAPHERQDVRGRPSPM